MTESRVVKPGEVRVLLLPVGSRSVVLPNSAVAEIISFQGLTTQANVPEWWLGRLDWRGHTIPVVSFEGIVRGHESEHPVQRTHIAVLNTLNGNNALPYIGLLIYGTARLLRISAANLSADAEPDQVSPLVLATVKVVNQKAWIPDLDALESTLLTAAS